MGMKVLYSAEFDCSPEALWPWLTDPEKQKQWMKGVVSNETTSGDGSSVGSTFIMKIKEGRQVSDYEGTITRYDEPQHLAVSLTGGCSKKHKMTMTADYALTDLGGRTRVDYESTCAGSGLMFKIFSVIFRPMAKMMIKSFFKKLKELSATPQEQESTPAT